MNSLSIEQTVTALNTLLARDRQMVSFYFAHSTLMDKSCGNTIFEFAPSNNTNFINLFPLGLLNGIVAGKDENGLINKRISIKYYSSDSVIIEEFYVEDVGVMYGSDG